MAYRRSRAPARRARTTRSRTRAANRSYSARRPSRRTSTARRRSTGSRQTVRIVLEHAQPGIGRAVVNPANFMQPPAAAPKKAMF